MIIKCAQSCSKLFTTLQREALSHIGQGGHPSAFMYRIVEDKLGAGSLASADLSGQINCILSMKISGLHPAGFWGVLLSNVPPDEFNPLDYVSDPKAYPGTIVIPFIKGVFNSATVGVPKRGFRYVYFFGILKVTPLEATLDLILEKDIVCDLYDRGQIRLFAT